MGARCNPCASQTARLLYGRYHRVGIWLGDQAAPIWRKRGSKVMPKKWEEPVFRSSASIFSAGLERTWIPSQPTLNKKRNKQTKRKLLARPSSSSIIWRRTFRTCVLQHLPSGFRTSVLVYGFIRTPPQCRTAARSSNVFLQTAAMLKQRLNNILEVGDTVTE